MRKQFLVAVGCIVSTVACAQEWKPAIEKWRACADANAVRYSKTAESAPVVARLAALACDAEKKEALRAIAERDGNLFAQDYVETAERYYIDRLSINIMEMRLR